MNSVELGLRSLWIGIRNFRKSRNSGPANQHCVPQNAYRRAPSAWRTSRNSWAHMFPETTLELEVKDIMHGLLPLTTMLCLWNHYNTYWSIFPRPSRKYGRNLASASHVWGSKNCKRDKYNIPASFQWLYSFALSLRCWSLRNPCRWSEGKWMRRDSKSRGALARANW